MDDTLIPQDKTVSQHGAPEVAPLLRPEPKVENRSAARGGSALFGVAFAALAVVAIYHSSPVDLPEWTDCPVQSIGHCGR
ncbi:MAG: hypothetical protein JNL25_06930 [Rhodospirillaceae bacterium]|nr:hypothetical protein [Rhodospirillaceae bacterium]